MWTQKCVFRAGGLRNHEETTSLRPRVSNLEGGRRVTGSVQNAKTNAVWGGESSSAYMGGHENGGNGEGKSEPKTLPGKSRRGRHAPEGPGWQTCRKGG